MKIIISLAFVESGSVIDIWIWFFLLLLLRTCTAAAAVPRQRR